MIFPRSTSWHIHTSLHILYISYYNKMPVACQGFNNFS
nr:MAG TPA: hypothetical protein [Bacteriophage sp.]